MTHTTFGKELPSLLAGAEHLPSLPAVAVEVLRLTEDENSTLDEMADALARDPVLSAKLLKLSNSSLFSVGSEITTLQRAAMVLGLKTVKLMALSFSLVGTLPRAGRTGDFALEHYWRHSLVGAVVGRSLAQRVGNREDDEAFLCGLLGHLGKLVLAQCLAGEYGKVTAAAGPWPSLADEEEVLGFHSADVTVALLREWGIPSSVCTSIAHRHHPEGAPADLDPRHRDLLALTHVAVLAEEVLCEEEKGAALHGLYEQAAARWGLDEEQVDAFLLHLEPVIRETADLLSVEAPGGESHETIIERARQQIVEISLGTAVDLEAERRRNAALVDETRDLRHRATTDALTGLPNRAAFDQALSAQVHARLAGRVPRALGLIMLDIDKFKNFNDTYGHPVGDEVLRMVGSCLQRLTRKGDLPARYGGEEFVVMAPQTTPYGLRVLCERLRRAIESEGLEVEGRRLSVTASFGAAGITSVESPEDGRRLLRLADRLLYRAKEGGRNRSEVYPRVQLPGP